MLEKLLNVPGFGIDIETDSKSGKKKDNLHFKRCYIVCVGFAYEEEGEIKSFCLTWEDVLKERYLLIRLLSTKKLVGQNLKFDLKVLLYKILVGKLLKTPNMYFDTCIAAKLLNENEKCGLKDLAKKYLKEEWGEWQDFKSWTNNEKFTTGTALTLAKQEYLAHLKMYCAKDAEMTYRLADLFKRQLEREALVGLFSLEMRTCEVLLNTELRGVKLDLTTLQKLLTKYTRHVERVRRWLYLHTGEEFNINSPKQLAHVLFDLKKLPILKRSVKTNEPSTDIGTLTKLSRDGHRFVDALLLYRHWEMLKRHIEKLLKEEIDGRIYPTFNTIGTETGRFSCKEPNLQQIPSKNKESRAIRAGFTGDLIIADYSNVELRILAHYSRDPRLLDVYKPGGSGDLHSRTAELLGVSRSQAKTINFGIGYGMGPRKLADDLNITEEEATKLIDKWYSTYNFVTPWKKSVIEFVKKYGFIKSIGGRKRRIDFSKLEYNEQWGAEREAVNFVIQGSSADITKMAIVALKDEKILLQVHDELVIERGNRSAEEIKGMMENVVVLRVPLTVDIKECKNWGMAKG